MGYEMHTVKTLSLGSILYALCLVATQPVDAQDVFFTTMEILDCKEAGACDWHLSCALGAGQASTTFFTMREANTGDNIPINRTLKATSYPVTVNCTVREHDGGIGASWEDVGTNELVVQGAGSYTISFDNGEGQVDVMFTVSNALATTSQGLTSEEPAAEDPPIPHGGGGGKPEPEHQTMAAGE
jgi:hypothetical protein